MSEQQTKAAERFKEHLDPKKTFGTSNSFFLRLAYFSAVEETDRNYLKDAITRQLTPNQLHNHYKQKYIRLREKTQPACEITPR